MTTDPTTAEARAALNERLGRLRWECQRVLSAEREPRGTHGFVTWHAGDILVALDAASGLAAAVEAWLRHLEAVPSDVTEVDRWIVAVELRALLAAHPAPDDRLIETALDAPVPDQQAAAAVLSAAADGFGDDPIMWSADDIKYVLREPGFARTVAAALATGQGPDTGGEGDG